MPYTNHSDIMKNRGLLFSVLSGLFGVAFYFSGLFVLFTPLSFLYSAARSGAKGFWISCLTALVAVGSIYFWFLPFRTLLFLFQT